MRAESNKPPSRMPGSPPNCARSLAWISSTSSLRGNSMAVSALRQALIGVPATLEDLAGDLVQRPAAGCVFHRPEDQFPLPHRGLEHVADLEANRLENRGRKDYG